MRTVLTIFSLLLSIQSACAEWVVATPTVNNGELALLRWRGSEPPDFMVGSFDNKIFYAEMASAGPVALIGIDLKTPSGQFPISLVSVDSSKVTYPQTLLIKVQQKDRGISRLTLPPEMVTPKEPALLARIESERSQLAEIFAIDSGPLVADLFQLPVPDKMNSPFGKKRVLNGLPRAPHSGADFRSPSGRLVRTPARGDVVFNGELYYTGNTVILDHGAGLYSLYAHLSRSLCKVDQRLEPGQPLGKVGSTGRSTGAHLHWTVKLRKTGIDPISVVDRFGSKSP